MKLFKLISKKLFVLLIFCLLTAIFFYKPIFIDRNYLFVSDLQLDFVTQFFAAAAMKAGDIPLWDPYYYGPFIAYYNSAVFYPLNLIAYPFYNLADLNFSFSLFIFIVIFHFVLAGFFMYLLLRLLKCSDIASFLGAFTFAFSGFLIGQMIHVQIFYSACYAPLLFYFLIKSIEEHNFYVICSGLTLATMLLAGHPQPTIYYCFLILAFCTTTSIQKFRQGETLARWIKPIMMFCLICFIGFGITAIQLVPFFEFIPHSLRSNTTYHSMSNLGSVAPAHLITLIFPDFFGGRNIPFWGLDFSQIGIHEVNYYMGIGSVMLLFLLIGIIPTMRKPRYFYFFLFCGIIGLIYMLGSYTIVSAWIYLIPGLSKMRLPCRIGSVVNFSFSIMVGYSLHLLLKEADKAKAIILEYRNFLIGAILAIISWVAIFSFHIAKVSQDFLAYSILCNVRLGILRFSLFFSLYFALLCLFYLKNKYLRSVAIISFLLLTIVDIFSYQMDFYPRVASQKDSQTAFESALSNRVSDLREINFPEAIKNDVEVFRVRMAELYDMGRFSSINGIFSLGYGGAVSVARLSEFRKLFENPEPPYNILNPKSKLLDFYNVKYFYSKQDLTKIDPKYKKLDSSENWYINTKAFPRAFCVNNFLLAKEKEAIFEQMLAYNLKDFVILQEMPLLKHNINSQAISTCTIEKYSDSEVAIRVDMKSPGFLVLSDLWYPGWKGFVDDVPVKLYTANYTFRALEVPAGLHKVMFKYEPFSIKIGSIISIFTIFITILLSVKLRRKEDEK